MTYQLLNQFDVLLQSERLNLIVIVTPHPSVMAEVKDHDGNLRVRLIHVTGDQLAEYHVSNEDDALHKIENFNYAEVAA